MTAKAIAKALGGRQAGRGWMARCPAHDDRKPSLSISTGDQAKVLVHCHAGCDQGQVIAALQARGLWNDGDRRHGRFAHRETCPAVNAPLDHNAEKRSAAALAIWRSAVPITGSLCERYLRVRGIKLTDQPSLRFHPGLRYHENGTGALILPAMMAGIQWPDRRVRAIQRTFLDPRGDRKAQVTYPRKTLGPFKGGALRLGPAGFHLGIAEGLETGLSAMQLFKVPVWCACGARLAAIDLPPEVKTVHVFADNGTPGREAAERAADRYNREGRRVELRSPPTPFGDWNDVIGAQVAA